MQNFFNISCHSCPIDAGGITSECSVVSTGDEAEVREHVLASLRLAACRKERLGHQVVEFLAVVVLKLDPKVDRRAAHEVAWLGLCEQCNERLRGNCANEEAVVEKVCWFYDDLYGWQRRRFTTAEL